MAMVSVDVWLAERQEDIDKTYAEALEQLAPYLAANQQPRLSAVRTVALACLAWTYYPSLDGMLSYEGPPGMREVNGRVFGEYAPCAADLDEYGLEVVHASFDFDDPYAGARLMAEMVAAEKANPVPSNYRELIANLPPPPMSLLPPDLLAANGTSSRAGRTG